MRAFFAVNLPGEIPARIADRLRPLHAQLKGEPIRWVRPEILHLTLRFLGETSDDRLDSVAVAARTASSSWPAFRLELGRPGCFPDSRRPRVLWISADDPTGAVERIATDLEQIARSAGFEAERRGFTPHLTVARFRDGLSPEGQAALASALASEVDLNLGAASIEVVHLMRSTLRPTGPEYTPISAYQLGPPPGAGR